MAARKTQKQQVIAPILLSTLLLGYRSMLLRPSMLSDPVKDSLVPDKEVLRALHKVVRVGEVEISALDA